METVAKVVCLALVLVAAGCGPTYYEPPPTVSLDTRQEHRVRIFADGGWQSTGVRVKSDEQYELSAEGRWSLGPLCGIADPDGSGNNNAICTGPAKPVPGYPTATLVGRIGLRGVPFTVGRSLTLTTRGEGIIYLGVNAESMLFDNTGSLDVAVRKRDTEPAGSASRKPEISPAPTRRVPPQASLPAPPTASSGDRHLAETPLPIRFAGTAPRPDDIAVIIGNADYTKEGKDIPDVAPAYADAEGFKRYATQALGVREGNIIFIRDATQANMISVFGSETNHEGRLFNWVMPGQSNVYVYYSGHGAPGDAGGESYLVPVDADAATIELNGYSLRTLYANLSRIPARSITVVLEACFSGASPGGSVISNASPVYLRPKPARVPPNLTVIAAGAANQIASWERDKSHGLFTKYFLKGVSGEADAAPYGNGNGTVGWDELGAYLRRTLTYFARRYYGRDQTAQIVVGKGG